jgi:hypothetical protein
MGNVKNIYMWKFALRPPDQRSDKERGVLLYFVEICCPEESMGADIGSGMMRRENVR